MGQFILLLSLFSPAPCVPQNIQNNLDCLSGVLNVTWQSTGYAPHFRASVVSSNGHVSICKTDKHHCIVHNMQCGLTYSVTVVAHDEACNSSHSPTKQINTGMQDMSVFVKLFLMFYSIHVLNYSSGCRKTFLLCFLLTSIHPFLLLPQSPSQLPVLLRPTFPLWTVTLELYL